MMMLMMEDPEIRVQEFLVEVIDGLFERGRPARLLLVMRLMLL